MVRTPFMRLLRRTGVIITPRRYPRPLSTRARTFSVALLVVAAGLLATSQAQSAGSNRHLWATVNVCDTAAHPDTIGVRGSMPGTASGRETMFMRFQAQYHSTQDGRWHNVPGEGDSGFLEVGRANVTARQKGRYIKIEPRSASVLLRGIVTFEWRRKDEVVRRAQRRTHKGHTSKAGADPSGYSATNCVIKQ